MDLIMDIRLIILLNFLFTFVLFFLSFTIEDLYGSRQFLVNLDINFCFESFGDCYKNITVFKDTLLPKKLCPFTDNPGITTLHHMI